MLLLLSNFTATCPRWSAAPVAIHILRDEAVVEVTSSSVSLLKAKKAQNQRRLCEDLKEFAAPVL
jgi:hypothetical protein